MGASVCTMGRANMKPTRHIWFCRDQPPSPGAANICNDLLVASILSYLRVDRKTITRFGFERGGALSEPDYD